MSLAFLERLTTVSTVGDLPGHRAALQLSDRGKVAGDLFASDARLPGILLGDDGRFRTAVSRRYYLDAIGRYCGMDLYHPRPLRFMMTRYEELGGPLVLHSSTTIPEAVRRGLERPRELLYEPLVIAEEARPLPPLGSVRLVDFEDLLAAGSRLTSLRAEQMRHILSSVREGLLLIDADLRVAPEYSDSVEVLLGQSGLAGERLPDVLARSIDAEQADIAGGFIETLFNPRVIENLVEKINPLLRVVTLTNGRVLSFGFTRRLYRGVIEGVLVRIQDVTREDALGRDLEQERQRAEERLQLALALVQVEPEALSPLLGRLRSSGGELRRAALASTPLDGDVRAHLRRELHAAKGDASLLGLQPLAAAVHAVENALAVAAAADPHAAPLGHALDRLEETLGGVDGIVRRFAGFRSGVLPAAEHASNDHGPMDTLAKLLAQTERFVLQLARDLGKAARFLHRVPTGLLDGDQEELLRGALAQLTRNSLVHGVEKPAERRRAGKPDAATLQLVVRPAPQAVEIVFQDDGRGLDLDKLRERAREAGLQADADPASVIFLPGVSTAERADLHAGRGVGLDVVARRVRDGGGKLAVHSEPGRYCAFRILLPVRRPS